MTYVKCEECSFREKSYHGFNIWYCKKRHGLMIENQHTKIVYVRGCREGDQISEFKEDTKK